MDKPKYRVAIVEELLPNHAEEKLNKILEEASKDGYDCNVVTLTVTTISQPIPWRFVVFMTLNELMAPPDANQ